MGGASVTTVGGETAAWGYVVCREVAMDVNEVGLDNDCVVVVVVMVIVWWW